MSYPLPTLGPTIDATGISIPSYNDVYQSLIASFQNIFGSAIYISPDSQDGQWIAIIAAAINQSNMAAVAVFQSFSPTFAQGAGLASLVKINGLMINTATNSTAVGTVIGVAATVITNGIVQDANGNLWNLPPSVTIPGGGSILVTVTAQALGSIVALAGTINAIASPQLGWQSFASTNDAVPGAPVESDSALRIRQSVSTAMPALTIKGAISAAVGNVVGVTRFVVWENDTGSTDSNGIPAHSISVVTYGGSIADITLAIYSRKTAGIQTYGTTSGLVYDQVGLPTTINYFTLTVVPIYFAVTIKAVSGYTAATGVAIQSALAAYVNSLAIGEPVYVSQCQAAASLIAIGAGQTFYITIFNLGLAPSPTGTANLGIAFNAAASCNAANINLVVT